MCVVDVNAALLQASLKLLYMQINSLAFYQGICIKYSKLCENIGILIKNCESTNPGSNKVVYGVWTPPKKLLI